MTTLFRDLAGRARSWWRTRLESNGPSWAAAAIIKGLGDSARAAEAHERAWQCTPAPAAVRFFGRKFRRDAGPPMQPFLQAAALAALCFAVLAPVQSPAQGCGEGRTASGQCTDVTLAAAARRTAIVFSQPKISTTAFPVMPSTDARVRYPHELNPNPLQPSPTGVLAPERTVRDEPVNVPPVLPTRGGA